MIIFPYCYTCIIRTRSFWSTNKLKFIWLFVHLISCVIEFSEFLGYFFYLFFNFIRTLLSKSKLCWENPVALIQKTIQKSEEKNYPCIRIIWYYIILKFRNLKRDRRATYLTWITVPCNFLFESIWYFYFKLRTPFWGPSIRPWFMVSFTIMDLNYLRILA